MGASIGAASITITPGPSIGGASGAPPPPPSIIGGVVPDAKPEGSNSQAPSDKLKAKIQSQVRIIAVYKKASGSEIYVIRHRTAPQVIHQRDARRPPLVSIGE
ncbi:MAG: hypothetical protein Tsb0020_34190 [Haliangiales bacterium]